MALAFSRSSIIMRSCISRAAHPRVNAPAFALVANEPRQAAASTNRIPRKSPSFVMAVLHFAAGGAVRATCALLFRGDILGAASGGVNQPDVLANGRTKRVRLVKKRLKLRTSAASTARSQWDALVLGLKYSDGQPEA